MAATNMKQGDGPKIVRIKWDSGATGQETRTFVTHRDDPLRRIFLDFCDCLNLVYSSVKFTFDGARVREYQTPRDLEMADGDVIQATSVKEKDGPIVVRIQYSYGPFSARGQPQSFLTHTRDDPLRRIFLDFCDALDIPYSSVKFIFRSARVCESQTPRDLEMADGDVIDAIVVLRGC